MKLNKFTFPVLFFIAYLAVNLSTFRTPVNETGDMAANAMQIERASRFQETLGPYSRGQFHHFGPVSYYYLSLMERPLFFIKTIHRRHQVAQILLNFMLMLAIHSILYSFLKNKQTIYLFLPAVLFSISPLGKTVFLDIWGPVTLILPMALFITAAAGLSTGRLTMIIPGMASFIFMLHNHVGTLSITLPVTMLSFYFYYRNRPGNKISRQEIRFALYALAMLLVTSVPPLIEEFTAAEGNITKIIRFFIENKAAHKIDSVLRYTFKYYADPFAFLGEIPGIIVFVFLLFSTLPFHYHKKTFEYYLRTILLFTVFMTVIGVARINGSMLPYIFWHHYAVVSLLFFLALSALMPPLFKNMEKYKQSFPGLSIFAILSITFLLYQPVKEVYDNQIDIFRDFIKPEPGVTYKLEWDETGEDLGQWTIATGIALRLEREGYSVCVTDKWLFMFPEQMSCGITKFPVATLEMKTIAMTLKPELNATGDLSYKQTRIIRKKNQK